MDTGTGLRYGLLFEGSNMVGLVNRAADGTAAPALHATHYETVRLDIAAANTSYGFDTSGSMHFQEGDVIAFKINPTSNPDETNYTHILELYTRSMSASGSFNS